MSANPQNAGAELTSGIDLSVVHQTQAARPTFAGYNALQALLAFSSLHEQIRQKRTRTTSIDIAEPSSGNIWELEHFVLDEVLQLVTDHALAITGADGIAIAMAENNAIVCRHLLGRLRQMLGFNSIQTRVSLEHA